MIHASEIEAIIAPELEALGLYCFGWFIMEDSPFTGSRAVLIGNRPDNGVHHMWEVFSTSAEFSDNKANALDR